MKESDQVMRVYINSAVQYARRSSRRHTQRLGLLQLVLYKSCLRPFTDPTPVFLLLGIPR